MAKLPPITINISAGYKFTEAQLESLKNAFNMQLASISPARKGESDSPVGETNISRQPSTKSRPKRTTKTSAKKR